MSSIRVPDEGPIRLPAGEFTICTGCRRPIDPNDPATIRAHTKADVERLGREPGIPIELHFFHPNHFPGHKQWRVASDREPEPYLQVQRMVLPLAAQLQLASWLTDYYAPGADRAAANAKLSPG